MFKNSTIVLNNENDAINLSQSVTCFFEDKIVKPKVLISGKELNESVIKILSKSLEVHVSNTLTKGMLCALTKFNEFDLGIHFDRKNGKDIVTFFSGNGFLLSNEKQSKIYSLIQQIKVNDEFFKNFATEFEDNFEFLNFIFDNYNISSKKKICVICNSEVEREYISKICNHYLIDYKFIFNQNNEHDLIFKFEEDNLLVLNQGKEFEIENNYVELDTSGDLLECLKQNIENENYIFKNENGYIYSQKLGYFNNLITFCEFLSKN